MTTTLLQVVFKLPPELQAPEAAELLHGKKRQMWVMVQVSLQHRLQYSLVWMARQRHPSGTGAAVQRVFVQRGQCTLCGACVACMAAVLHISSGVTARTER